MGQISSPQSPPSIILSSVDRLIASNADGGVSPGSSHIILLGEIAGQNLGASNIIAIGWRALSGGFPAGDADNSTVVGENSFPGPADLTTGKGLGLGAVTVLGGSNYAAITTSRRFAGLISIGAGIAPNFTGVNDGGMDRSILIGNSIFKNNTLDNALSSGNVILGHHAAARASLNGQATQYIDNIIIGENAGPQVDTLSSIIGNTVIGSRAMQGFLGPGGDNTVIGRVAALTLTNGLRNVILGVGAEIAGNATDTVAIGANITHGATTDGVYLGAGQAGGFTGARNIMIGRGAGDSEASPNSDRFILETFTAAAVRRTLLYGNLNDGNLLLGLSTPAVNRDFRGTGQPTNVLKLLNGIAGTGAGPTGGGYLQAVAGQLTWTDSAANVYDLTPSAILSGLFTVGTLPAAPAQGTRAYVTDGLAPVFAAAAVGAGAVFTPVYFDGAIWLCG